MRSARSETTDRDVTVSKRQVGGDEGRTRTGKKRSGDPPGPRRAPAAPPPSSLRGWCVGGESRSIDANMEPRLRHARASLSAAGTPLAEPSQSSLSLSLIITHTYMPSTLRSHTHEICNRITRRQDTQTQNRHHGTARTTCTSTLVPCHPPHAQALASPPQVQSILREHRGASVLICRQSRRLAMMSLSRPPACTASAHGRGA